MHRGNTFVNALIGAGIATLLAALPFSTVLGGGVAGYLQGSDLGAGTKVGAITGAIAMVPLLLALFFLGSVFSIWGMMAMGPRGGGFVALSGAFVLAALVVGTVYAVGFSAVGGFLGAYVRRESDRAGRPHR